MNVLFVHNNFPGQYQHLARALAKDSQMQIAAIGSSTSQAMSGVNLLKYSLRDVDVSATHPFARRFDLECHRAEQVLYALSSLASSEFVPDLIMAHPGWGETLPLRTIFPDARIVLYCEFFYGMQGRDVGFDPEFPETGADGHVALHLKNASTLLALADCDSGMSPTEWQRSTFPKEYQGKITTIHEGIDVDIVKPAPDAVLRLSSGRELRRSDEVVTFVARNLEPVTRLPYFHACTSAHHGGKTARGSRNDWRRWRFLWCIAAAGNDVEINVLRRSRRQDRPKENSFRRSLVVCGLSQCTPSLVGARLFDLSICTYRGRYLKQ